MAKGNPKTPKSSSGPRFQYPPPAQTSLVPGETDPSQGINIDAVSEKLQDLPPISTDVKETVSASEEIEKASSVAGQAVEEAIAPLKDEVVVLKADAIALQSGLAELKKDVAKVKDLVLSSHTQLVSETSLMAKNINAILSMMRGKAPDIRNYPSMIAERAPAVHVPTFRDYDQDLFESDEEVLEAGPSSASVKIPRFVSPEKFSSAYDNQEEEPRSIEGKARAVTKNITETPKINSAKVVEFKRKEKKRF